MALKRKDELLGDGAGYGTKVPVSLTNPSGYASANRGVGFGEAVTSAASNRPHEAILDNTDALDDRLVDFETGGLDAAYDLGTVGPAGGGRSITKDAGAIETTSALSTPYGDDLANAHFRANASGDTGAGGVGFDFVGTLDAAAGLVDRRVMVFSSDTNITATMNATLNPGGAGATIVRLTDASRKFHTSTATDLILSYDLVEILSGSYRGLYLIYGLGGSNTDVTLRRLHQTTPSFASDTVTTVRVLRPQFRSGSIDSLVRGAAQFVGIPTASAALSLLSGSETDADVSAGAIANMNVYVKDANGVARKVSKIDGVGRVVSELGPAHTSDTVQQRRNGGWHGFIKDYSQASFGATDHGGGFLAWAATSGANNPQARLDFLSLINYAAGTGLSTSFSITLGATSPTQGVVTFSSAPASDWEDKLPPMSFVYIISGAELGLYYVVDTNPAGSGTLTLRNLNGTIPSHLGTSGSRTAIHYAPQIVGARLQSFPLNTTALRERSSGSQTTTPYNVLTAGGESDAAALVVTSPRNEDEATEMRALIRGISANATGAHTETFLVEPKGLVIARTGFKTATGGTVQADGFTYVSTYSRQIQVPLAVAQPSEVPPADAGWYFTAAATVPRWYSTLNSGVLNVPLSQFLRTGQAITKIEVIGTMATGHGTAAAVLLVKRTTNWTTPAVSTETTVAHSAVTAFSAGSVSKYEKTYTTSNTVDLSIEDWYLKITAGDTGASNSDWLHAFRITVQDIGPRNY